MKSHVRNPYAQTGRQVGSIVDSFINAENTRHAGYLDATGRMADIEGKQIANAKALDEVMRSRKAGEMTGYDIAAAEGVPAEVIEMHKRGEMKGITPEDLVKIQRNMKAVALRNAGQGYDVKPSGVLEDIEKMQARDQIRAGTATPNEITEIFAATQGRFPPSDQFNLNDAASMVTKLVPMKYRPMFMSLTRPGGRFEGNPYGAFQAIMSKMDTADINEIMRLTNELPLATLGLKLEDDPEKARQQLAQWLRDFQRDIATARPSQPPKKPPPDKTNSNNLQWKFDNNGKLVPDFGPD